MAKIKLDPNLFTVADLEKEKKDNAFLLSAEEILGPYRSGCRIRGLAPIKKDGTYHEDFIFHLNGCSVALYAIGEYRSAMIVTGDKGPKAYFGSDDTYLYCVNKYLED